MILKNLISMEKDTNGVWITFGRLTKENFL